MANRQISEEEYRYLQNRRVTADFVESIYNDPKLNKEAKTLIKKKYPQLPIPDYDMEKKIDDRFAARDKQIQDRQNARKQKEQEEKWKADRERVQQQYGFTDDAMERMEKTMVDKQIGDYDAAAMYFAAKEPKTAQDKYNGQYWNHHKKEEFKQISDDPEGWGRDQLMDALYKDQERQKGWR